MYSPDPIADTLPRPPLAFAGGSWAFRHRSWLPVPLALLALAARPSPAVPLVVPLIGATLLVAGHALRCWAVRHIGDISRTRAARTGPLIQSGPYAFVRNPLYIGNWLLWTGLALGARLLWLLPIAWAIFALQYGAIVRWEEGLLAARSRAYRAYAVAVPRWVPRACATFPSAREEHTHPWSHVLFSERGTFAATLAVAVGVAVKQWLW